MSEIQSRPYTDKGRREHDRIFNKKKKLKKDRHYKKFKDREENIEKTTE